MLHYLLRKNTEEIQPQGVNIDSYKRKSVESVSKKIKNYVFNLDDVIGKGSFSTVYLGHNQITFESVAVKVIQLEKMQSEVLNELLNSQVALLQQLNHPNILKCYDIYFSATNCYIVTEYCNQGDLKEKLKKQGKFDEKLTGKIITQVYEGLKYLNKRSIIHRDLKASNILLKNGQVKIADFGFAKKIKQKTIDVSIGSPLYMSPQGLINNIYGSKTDVWSFGIFIYEILHQNNPFCQCQNKEELKRAILEPIKIEQLRPQLSFQLKQLIVECLQVDYYKRISMEHVEFCSYFSKLKDEINSNNSINRISEQYHFEKEQSGASTQIPLTTYVTSKGMRRNQSLSHKQYNNVIHQDYRSPKSTNQYKYKLNQYSPKKQRSNNLITMHSRNHSKDHSIRNQRSKSFKFNKENQLKSKNLTISPCFKYQSKISLPIPNQLFTNLTQFREIISVLHYSRLLFKIIKLCQKFPKTNINYLKSWLFQILRDLIQNILSIQNPLTKIQQLKSIALQYQHRYSNELSLPSKQYSTTRKVKQLMIQSLKSFKMQKQKQKQINEISIHLIYFYELTDKLEEAIEKKNYKIFTENNRIERFLESNKSN